VRRGADGRATIAFGDGENGMIPPRLASGNVGTITATYRVGGGPQGNVARNTDMVPSLGEIQEAVNLEPAAGGAAAESLDRARAFAPRLFRAQERAVTTGDYEDLALQVPGVGKVRAVALNWNEVVLYVAPAGQVAEPSETLVRDLRAYFEHRRLATASVEVVGPDAVDVFLRATVQAQPYFRERDVRVAVEHAVDEVLAFERIGFGQRLYVSRLYEAIQELPQVAGLTIDQFSRTRDGSVDTAGVLQLGPSELPRPGYRDGPGRPPIEIVVQGAATESA
jgi:predicted phage baseplate assembly protein